LLLQKKIGDEPQYLRTPGGLGWSSCIYQIPNGAHIKTDLKGKTTVTHEGIVEEYPACSKPFKRNVRSEQVNKRDSPDDGWQVWTSWNNPDNATFTAFLGDFNVPKSPANWDGGILYMFTGLQNDNWIPYQGNSSNPPETFEIIQPVLQYGQTPAGGGNYWAVASWYVTVDENVFYSQLIQCKDGDNIFGNMSRINESSWYIGSLNTNNQQSQSVTVDDPRLITQPWAYCTLEVYEIDDCANDFPAGPLKFTNMKIFDQNGKAVVPSWQAFNNGDDHCGATAVVNSPSSVTINFNA